MTRRIIKPGYMGQEKKALKIHVSELRVGMFVSELDRPWLETPFLLQGFRIEEEKTIDILREYSEYVFIDATDNVWIEAQERNISSPKKSRQRYQNTRVASAEQGEAHRIYTTARRVTKTLYEEVALGGGIDTEQARVTVSECVDSVLRNSDALIWMSRLREEDEYTAEHSLHVCILAITFGRGLGLSVDELQNIGLCGLLHDIGKMRVPPEVLNKPSKLTEKEFSIMKGHAVQGRNLLMASDSIYHGVIDVAYSHHERIDGTGYPRQLKAAAIPQFAKIIAIVDAYDAMTADRCYAKAMTCTEALKEIYQCRGTHFDEDLAVEFLRVVGLYPPGTIVELASGEVAIVTAANYRYQHLPEVVVVLDKNKSPVPHSTVNLAKYVDKSLGSEYLVEKVHASGAFGINIRDYLQKGFKLG